MAGLGTIVTKLKQFVKPATVILATAGSITTAVAQEPSPPQPAKPNGKITPGINMNVPGINGNYDVRKGPPGMNGIPTLTEQDFRNIGDALLEGAQDVQDAFDRTPLPLFLRPPALIILESDVGNTGSRIRIPKPKPDLTVTPIDWSTDIYSPTLKALMDERRKACDGHITSKSEGIPCLQATWSTTLNLANHLNQDFYLKRQAHPENLSINLATTQNIEILNKFCIQQLDQPIDGSYEALKGSLLDKIEDCAERIHFVAYHRPGFEFNDLASISTANYQQGDPTIRGLKEIAQSGLSFTRNVPPAPTAGGSKLDLK